MIIKLHFVNDHDDCVYKCMTDMIFV